MGSLLESAPVRTASVNYPELVVEWLPNHGPFVDDGEWCDITAYVVSGATTRGRQYELNQFQAGTCSLTLQATTRLFDPDNAAGPFYPWLVPMRQLRISAVWNSTRYPVFRGYITDWGQTTLDDAIYQTTITARDAFVLFEQIELASSAFATTVQNLAPTAWFRFNETGTTRVTDSTNNGAYGTFEKCEQGVDGLVPGDNDRAAAFAWSGGERVTVTSPSSFINDYPFSVSVIAQVDDSYLDQKTILWDGWLGLVRITVRDTTTGSGYLQAYVTDGSATRDICSTVTIDNDQPHHILVVFESATSVIIYIDGVDCTGTALSSGSPAAPLNLQNLTIGNKPSSSASAGFGATERGTLDEIAIWKGLALSATQAANLAAAASGWIDDDTGTRVGRILDLIGWPTTRRSVSAGASVLGPSRWTDGVSVLNVLQSLADTELGAFFIGTAGDVVWRSRHYAYATTTAKTSQATFGDGHSSGALKYLTEGFALTRDETLIRNPVLAPRAEGITATARDAAYVEKYGLRTWSAPISQERDDASMQDRATWLIARYKELETRLAGMQIAPRTDAANLWPKALGLEIGDRITVKRTPLGLNAEVSVDQIIESVSHQFSPGEWVTTYQGSPVDVNANTYLVLDDATYGALDTYRLAY